MINVVMKADLLNQNFTLKTIILNYSSVQMKI